MVMRGVLCCGVEACVCVFEGAGCCVGGGGGGGGQGGDDCLWGDALMRARVQGRLVCLGGCVYGRSHLLCGGAHLPQS